MMALKASSASCTMPGCATHVPSWPSFASRSLSARTLAKASSFAIDQHMLLHQMPAAGPGHKHGDLLIELVLFSFGIGEINRASNGVAQIDLTFHHVSPGRRVRVFKIRHENLCAGIQRVDDHLAIGRPRDFDPSVLDIAWDRRTLPVAFADLFRLGQEVEPLALIKPSLPFLPPLN